MKKSLIPIFLITLSAGLVIGSCTPRSRYERKLKHELASGVRNDSLFMGMYFGMPEKQFYIHCWDLNHKGLIKQGPSNTTVEYMIKDELRYPASMNFYPSFADGKISEMPVKFQYTGWAPWNKSLSSDSLQLDVLKWFKKTYGDQFMKIDHPKRGSAFVQISGNRRITIFRENEMTVWAIFTDMSVKQVAKDSTKTILPPQNVPKELK
ncbi:MAG: hypothetical protein GX431_12170 [Bacteroidales bacterium]|jgi:hypothetical protein|nr:hypothetical protein [Bacteroidales bacterium]